MPHLPLTAGVQEVGGDLHVAGGHLVDALGDVDRRGAAGVGAAGGVAAGAARGQLRGHRRRHARRFTGGSTRRGREHS